MIEEEFLWNRTVNKKLNVRNLYANMLYSGALYHVFAIDTKTHFWFDIIEIGLKSVHKVYLESVLQLS